MSVSKQPLVLTKYVYLDGNPVANGKVNIRLNVNGSVSNSQLGTQFSNISLDSGGNITGSPTFWPNSAILPVGTYYISNVYNEQGQLVGGPNITGVSIPWTFVRTATANQATGASVGSFATNNVGDVLIIGFISFGGTEPTNFPSTMTDTAGNTYNLLAQGGCVTFTQFTTYALYACLNCVASSSINSFTNPAPASVSNISMGVEFSSRSSVALDAVSGPVETPSGFTPNDLTVLNSTQGDLAVGMSLCISGVCLPDPSANARYSGVDYMMQDAFVTANGNYTQSFQFNGPFDQSFFLILIKNS